MRGALAHLFRMAVVLPLYGLIRIHDAIQRRIR